MYKIILLSIAFTSLSSFSGESIKLKSGEKTLVNGQEVSCEAQSNTSILNSYMQIPYEHQFNMLKYGGIGTCHIKTLQRDIHFLHTDKYPGGLRISINSGYMINEAIRDGDCSL